MIIYLKKLSKVKPDLVKKPCEDIFEITQEDKKFWPIHKVQKQKNKYINKSTSWVHTNYLLVKEYIDLNANALSYIFLFLTFLHHCHPNLFVCYNLLLREVLLLILLIFFKYFQNNKKKPLYILCVLLIFPIFFKWIFELSGMC